jgi:hypothetical protein
VTRWRCRRRRHGHAKCALCKLPVFDAQGAPVHEQGISARKSALVAGVADDGQILLLLSKIPTLKWSALMQAAAPFVTPCRIASGLRS